MGRLYAKIRAKFPKETVEEEQPNCVTSAIPRKLSLVVSNTAEGIIDTDDTQNELPIYEATAREINYWHAFGSNGFLQTLLAEYDLDQYSPNVATYQHFKIGFDEQNHRATFAVDETHYYAIDFDKYNAIALDRTQARAVLEKVSAIRLETRRFKDFCGFQIECFD